MNITPPRLIFGLGLACCLLSPAGSLASFSLSSVASLTGQVGASPYGLVSDSHGGFIGSTQNSDLADESSYIATGFNFDPTTNQITKQQNTGYSTWLPDGQGNYYTTQQYGGSANTGYLVEYNLAARTTKFLADFGTVGIASANNDLSFDGQGHLIGTSAYGGASGNGTIFSFDLASQKLKVLASFDGTNGSGVNANLVSDGQGHLYGTTNRGGTANSGTVFRFDVASGSLTNLVGFTGGNGSLPTASLVSDGKGGFLGTTGFGGTHGDGTVFRVDGTTGIVTTISNFSGTNGFLPASPLVADGQGGFLGSTLTGTTAATYNGTIFDVNPTSGELTMIGNFIGNRSSSFIPGVLGSGPSSLIVPDGFGNFYGTTRSGGVNNLGTIFKLTPNAVPEPASVILLCLGVLGASLIAKRKI